MGLLKGMLYMARRFKVETAMNLLGLTIGFVALYLMLTQVYYSRNYNRCVPDSERVFRLEMKDNVLHARFVSAAVSGMPQVEGVTEVEDWTGMGEFTVGDRMMRYPCVMTGLTPFGAIGTTCVDGQLQWDNYDQRSVIMPASFVRELYDGQTEVAGKQVIWEGDTVIVRGVYEDFPENCSMKNTVYYAGSRNIDNRAEWAYILYLKLRPEVDIAAFQHDFSQLFMPLLWEREWQNALASGMASSEKREQMYKNFLSYATELGYQLRPVCDIWFSGMHNGDKGNRTMLLILQLACLFVIIVSTANFFNFILASSPLRVRSVNTRRVLGEGVWKLRIRLITESVLTALACCLLSFALCAMIVTLHSSLFLGNVMLTNHCRILIFMVLLAVAMGLLAAVYPAFFVTSFEPAVALKSQFGLTPKGRRLRAVLIGMQLAIAIFMMIFIGILLLQSHYIYRSDYGFEKDEVLYAQLIDEMQPLKVSLYQELQHMEGVKDVSYSRFVLGSQDRYVQWSNSDKKHHRDVTFTCLYVDQHYLRTMGIRIVEGRDFSESDSDCYIISEAARKKWPWVRMGEVLMADDMPVVGVCENVRYATTHQDRSQEPVVFLVLGERYANWGDQLGVLNVRIAADADKYEVRQCIQHLLDQKGGEGRMKVQFIDQRIEQIYQEDFHFVYQMQCLSAVCLFLTLIGVFCLSMFETAYRRREIGIRRVMGASVSQILLLLCRRYAWLLCVSFVIAAPLAYYFGQMWLNTFAEHTTIYWWLFPSTLLMVGVVTMITVIGQSWHAAHENPVDCIKYE